MRVKISVLGLIFLFLASCVTTEAVKLGKTAQRPPVFWEDVIVYRTADQVPGKYEEIALLSSTGDADLTGEKQMWDSMRKKAGELGANAIILDSMSEPSLGAKIVSTLFLVSADRKGKAIAIYIFPPEEKK
ncbi:MAG: hypothetical protein OEW69_11540 [Nitrospirota bacterium]|nr:hypothetical protein [Nitrospirota bacterium]